MRRTASALLLQLMAAGCHASNAGSVVDAALVSDHPRDAEDDRDHDGLCDDSEAELGTNPDAIDTDGDGWSDLVEAIANTDPQDRNSPSPDQIAYLLPDPGTLDFNVASTADGIGAGASGQLIARNAFDRYGRRASDYYRGVIATGAEPPDNVRGIKPEAGYFQTIRGRTHLTFRLQFSFHDNETLDCASLLPFDFALKSDVGGYLSRDSYQLVLTPRAPPIDPQDFCRPVSCI